MQSCHFTDAIPTVSGGQQLSCGTASGILKEEQTSAILFTVVEVTVAFTVVCHDQLSLNMKLKTVMSKLSVPSQVILTCA